MMNQHAISRRKMLQSLGAAAGAGFALAAVPGSLGVPAAPVTARWRGLALGGEASMSLAHEDGARAREALALAVDELKRLEGIFSLYDPASALSRLNKTGVLSAPPLELVALFSAARAITEASGGAFDITVQTLWTHFHGGGTQPGLRDALAGLGQNKIHIGAATIKLAPGQSVTLNGIAQGAITDHLVALLQREGFDNILLNTGEIRALGSSPDGDPWRVALGSDTGPTLQLRSMAVATSVPAASGVHLFNPQTGASGGLYREVSVVAPTATLADGLSTALSVMPEPRWQAVLDAFAAPGLEVYARRLDGTRLRAAPNSGA